MLLGKNAALGEGAAWLVIGACGHDQRVRFYFAEVEHLTVSKEEQIRGLHHVLEDKVFVVKNRTPSSTFAEFVSAS